MAVARRSQKRSILVDQALIVVFPMSLWPLRSPLDGPSWFLAQGIAAAISGMAGMLGYATPRGRLDLDDDTIRVRRELPTVELVVAECQALGAVGALTGRLLVDEHGLEIWMNAHSGQTGDLLWTDRVVARSDNALWQITGLVRRFLFKEGAFDLSPITVQTIAGTGSWPAFVAMSRARLANDRFEIVRDAARALSLDPLLVSAQELLEREGSALIESASHPDECAAVRDALAPLGDLGPVVAIRKLAHERALALAKAGIET